MEKLYDYFIHFNHYTKEWNAVNRSKANEYMNGTLKAEDILRYKNIDDLINYIKLKK